MKKNLLFILFAHITTLGFSQVDWVPTNGPYGGGVVVLKNINNKVYAGTTCGIYSTIDNGITWENKSAGLNGECKWINDIEVLGNTLIASSSLFVTDDGENGIFLSYDFGNTWTQSNTGIIDSDFDRYINDVFVNGSDILIGTRNGVYKSINQGLSWNPSNIGINEPNMTDNAFQFTKNGSNIFLHVNFNIYKSTDNGFTWVNLNSPFYCNSIVSFGGSIYASTSNQGVYKTSNNGISWTQLNFNFPSTPLQIKFGGTKLYCASDSQTFESTDGISWSIVPHMGASGVYDNNILEVNNKVFWGGDGVYSRANGSTSVINSGLGGSSKTNVIFHDGNTMYAGSWNGIYKSTDNGNIWNNLGLTLPLNSIVNCITKSGSNLVIGTKVNGVYLSNDNGNTWTQSNNGLNINGVIYSNITSLFHYNGRLFMGAMENINLNYYATLFISDNNGVSWTQSATGLGPKYRITSICNFQQYIIIAVENAGTGVPGVYLSTDNGLSWLLDNPGYPVNLVCANSTSIFAANFEYVFSTIDIGNSWTGSTSGTYSIKTIANLNNSIYVVRNGIYKIINNIWNPISSNGLLIENPLYSTGQSYCSHLSSNQSGTIFIGERSILPYGGGYYQLNNGVSKYVGTNNLDEIQSKINYSISPNPTTSKITVKSSLELNGEEYIIYDQLGKEVMSGIISSEETEIDLSNISEGVYLFKVGEEMQETFRIIKQ